MLFHIVICWLNKHKIIQRYYKRRCFKFNSVKAIKAKKSQIIFFEKNLRVFSSTKKERASSSVLFTVILVLLIAGHFI